MTCRNCSRGKATRPRGLCWTCYYAEGVKDRYPITSKFAPKSRLANVAEPPLAPTPCPYPAGTSERMLCYQRRIEAGYAVFHPDDDPACAGEPDEREQRAKRRKAGILE